MDIRQRITEFKYLKGSEIQDNDGNWRIHPAHQRDALKGMLQEVGIVGTLLVYDSKKQGGLTLIDGHLRADIDPDLQWPCAIADLNDDEANQVLAFFDPLASLAIADSEKLSSLLREVNTDNEHLSLLLDQLNEQTHALVNELSESDDEYDDEYDETELWPKIVLQVSPEARDAFYERYRQLDGANDTEKIFNLCERLA